MITISIDLTKINKSKIKTTDKGQKFYGLILDKLDEPDKFGNTHTVYESQTKEERENKVRKNYLGNGKQWGK